jgi:hypothetical protein
VEGVSPALAGWMTIIIIVSIRSEPDLNRFPGLLKFKLGRFAVFLGLCWLFKVVVTLSFFLRVMVQSTPLDCLRESNLNEKPFLRVERPLWKGLLCSLIAQDQQLTKEGKKSLAVPFSSAAKAALAGTPLVQNLKNCEYMDIILNGAQAWREGFPKLMLIWYKKK